MDSVPEPESAQGISSQMLQVANATGVPATIKTRAINWLGRLVAGSILYPAVERARENMDTVAGRSRVNMMIAEEVGRQAVSDPEILERGKARFLSEHFRKQENVEAVAVLALEDLRETAEVTPSTDTEEADEDWLNVFSRYAEDASSERMQQLFAKVLAGEIRKPGSFSLATMRFVAELDRETAETFKDAARYITKDFIFKRAEWANNLASWLSLEDAGLIAGAAGTLQQMMGFEAGQTERIVAVSAGLGLVARAAEATQLTIPAMLLTRVGRELAALMPEPDAKNNLLAIAEHLKTQPCDELILGLVQSTGLGNFQVVHIESLWKRPEPSTTS